MRSEANKLLSFIGLGVVFVLVSALVENHAVRSGADKRGMPTMGDVSFAVMERALSDIAAGDVADCVDRVGLSMDTPLDRLAVAVTHVEMQARPDWVRSAELAAFQVLSIAFKAPDVSIGSAQVRPSTLAALETDYVPIDLADICVALDVTRASFRSGVTEAELALLDAANEDWRLQDEAAPIVQRLIMRHAGANPANKRHGMKVYLQSVQGVERALHACWDTETRSLPDPYYLC